MDGISAVIITRNEERNIRRCLESLKAVADEIVIVDDFSTDGTTGIGLEYNAKIITQHWQGFGPQKNAGNKAAKYDYILSLDADEALDVALANAIITEKRKGLHGAYCFFRLNYYYGKFIRHGLEYPDIKIRLFSRQEVTWQEELVHERLHLPPGLKTRRLNGHLLHYTYYRFEEHILKANKYTTLAAQYYVDNGKRPSLLKIVGSPVFTFVQAYLFKAGFLDGAHGFVLAIMHAHAAFVKYVKLWELHRNNHLPDER